MSLSASIRRLVGEIGGSNESPIEALLSGCEEVLIVLRGPSPR
jgi:hypothetical protein